MNMIKTSALALILSYGSVGFSQAKVRGSIVTKGHQGLGSSASLKPYGNIDWSKCDSRILTMAQVKQLSLPIDHPYGFCNQSPAGSLTTFLYTGDIQSGEVNVLMSVNQEDCGDIDKGKFKIWDIKKLLDSSKFTILDKVQFDGRDYRINTEKPIRAYKTGFNTFKLLVIPFQTPKGERVLAFVRNSKREFHLYAQDQNLKSLLHKVQEEFDKIL